MKQYKKTFFLILFAALFATVCSSRIKNDTNAVPNSPNAYGTEKTITAENGISRPDLTVAMEEDTEKLKEYLFITMTAYTNGIDDAGGVNLLLYCYDIANNQLEKLIDIPIQATFPANCVDFVHQKIYYADANEGEKYDNLFVYDMASGQSTQLTYGKYTFNDMLLIDGSLYVNTARQYATVLQPAVFDIETNTFTYLNSDDDDTWHYSMSYNYSTKRLLLLTCSDSEMRTHRVTAETHIRPKTISFLDKSLKNKQTLFSTEDFEIRLTRQLDEDHILMTVDPYMGSAVPRTLRLLTISTQEITDFPIPGIKQVYLFYPRDNGEGVFLIGKKDTLDSKWWLYYYDLTTEEITEVYQEEDLPNNYRALVNIVYSIQPAPCLKGKNCTN